MKHYKIENLTCAHCAATIEAAVGRLESVRSVNLQFATLDLHLDTSDFPAVERLIEQVEPGVRLRDAEASAAGGGEASPANEALGAPFWSLVGSTVVLSACLVVQGLGAMDPLVGSVLYGLVYLSSGWSVLTAVVRNLARGQVFDESFLMGVATLAAWLVGAGAEAASVMVFYQWGEFLQDRAVQSSRRSLGALLATRPRRVRVLEEAVAREVDPDSVAPGTLFEVRAGEQIALDATVVDGRGSVDTSALTGESLPRAVGPDSMVQAGYINRDGLLRLRSTARFADSAWSGLVSSVDQALARKAPLDRFMTRFARAYTPAVLLGSAVLFVALAALGLPWHEALYRSLVLLVISCPCALVLSIPLTYLGAMGAASRQGLLIRDPAALDRLATVDCAALDKTGTLTLGRPQVTGVYATADDKTLRRVLDAGFASSSHPLAKVWGGHSREAQAVVEHHGEGVVFEMEGQVCVVGRTDFLTAQGVEGQAQGPDLATTVHAGKNGVYLGRVEFEDLAKPETPQAVDDLRRLHLAPLALLSGEVEAVVQRAGQEWNLDQSSGGLTPQAKLDFVDHWEGQGRRVLFVGDGLNDTPVLARATVGVSLGAGASAAAIEASDVAVLDPSPAQIPRLVVLGRRTRVVLYQNIGLALGLKALFMVLGGLGLAGLWEAVFADVGVALLAVANSLRAARSL